MEKRKGCLRFRKVEQDLGFAKGIRDMAETIGAETGTRFHVKGRDMRKLRGGTRLGSLQCRWEGRCPRVLNKEIVFPPLL